MAKNTTPLLYQSENFNEEYCAQVVRVNHLEPVENSDNLLKAIVGTDYQVVVGKNDVQEGQIMIYCKIETVINAAFLSVNNQFELGERQLNSNYEEVQALIDEGKEEEAKRKVGYFNKHGRVRIVRLRGCPSEGVLFTIDSLAKWNPEILKFDFNACLMPDENGDVRPFNFDMIGKERFVKVYMPPVQTQKRRSGREQRRSKYAKRLMKLDRLVPGQYAEHYDTHQLRDNIWRFKPDTNVSITVKMHGTLLEVCNLLVKCYHQTLGNTIKRKNGARHMKSALKMPTRFYWQRKNKKNAIAKAKEEMCGNYTLKYGNITSSHHKIKNQYIDHKQNLNFYEKDIYMPYGKLIYPLLKPGMTVYCELCGYVDGTNSPIQKHPKSGAAFDYGCKPGESFVMPYRITETDPEGNRKEWELEDVYKWTLEQMEINWVRPWMRPLTYLYRGKLGDLYPDINTEEHWNENVLECMRNDVEHFGMEKNEPLCKNKVPREGIIVRIDNDPVAECFKLKTTSFLEMERVQYDNAQVDMEAMEGYGDRN